MFKNFTNSIYGPEYYRELKNKRLRTSFGYFFALTAILALLATIFVSVAIIPSLISWSKAYLDKLTAVYPSNLVVTMKSGIISPNQPEPIILPLPSKLPEPFQAIKNLVVLDTKTPLDQDQFAKYETMFLIKSDRLVSRNDKNQVVITPTDGKTSLTLDKAKIDFWAGKIKSLYPALMPLLVSLVFIGTFIGLSVFGLLSLIVIAFLLFLISFIFKLGLNYGRSYQLGLHAIALPLILNAIFMFTIRPLAFSFSFTVFLTLVIILINLRSQRGEGENLPVVPTVLTSPPIPPPSQEMAHTTPVDNNQNQGSNHNEWSGTIQQ